MLRRAQIEFFAVVIATIVALVTKNTNELTTTGLLTVHPLGLS